MSTERYKHILLQVFDPSNGAWLGALAADRQLGFACQFGSSSAINFNDCKIDDAFYVSGRVLTGTEVTEWHNSGVVKSTRSLSFNADIVSRWRFGDRVDDGTNVYDRRGTNHLTNANMDTSNYVTP